MQMASNELVLSSADWEVTLLPKVGGKVRQIVKKGTGDTLLVSPSKPYRQLPSDSNWTNFDTSGMDDCFPNIEPGKYPFPLLQGRHLFQRGEWVYGGWEVERAEGDVVTLGRKGTSFDYHARKTYHLIDANTLEVQYSVKNLSDLPFRYLWSAHPLFVVKDQFELRIPKDDVTFTTFPGEGEVYRWPFYASTDLSRQWLPRGDTLKTFRSGLSVGRCNLTFSGHHISITFDLNKAPILGIWFNNFGFPENNNPSRCIALEPCTSPSDVLGDLDESS
jgi:hypothetical protein